MEPRLLRRGNEKIADGWKYGPEASMEPRLLRRGNAFREPRHPCGPEASMEPRLLRRGNDRAKTGLNNLTSLQWSHAFSDVETMTPSPRAWAYRSFNGATPSQTWKQWRWRQTWRRQAGFNGATPSQTWKPGDQPAVFRRGAVASMEPRLLRRGNHDVNEGEADSMALQWSHAFSDVETYCLQTSPATVW